MLPHPKSTMSSLVVSIAEAMKEKKRNKIKITARSAVKSKVGNMEENTREGRSRRISKEVVVCVHTVARKKKFLIHFEDG